MDPELGTIDDWNLGSSESQSHLRKRFENDKDVKRIYMALAGQLNPGIASEQLCDKAWAICLGEFQQWYNERKDAIARRLKFHHAIRGKTDFLDIIECGHWKCDFLHKTVTEKLLDTTLAVDMIAKAETYDVAIVITGDADSIPSIKYLKDLGKHVACVEFLKGYPPNQKSAISSSRLKLTSDFVVGIYEMNIVAKGFAQKRDKSDMDVKAIAAAPACP